MKKFIIVVLASIILLSSNCYAIAEFGGYKIVPVFVDNSEVKGDVPAVLLNGRTMVPLRFVAEALGATLEWNDQTRTAYILSKPEQSSSKLQLLRNETKYLGYEIVNVVVDNMIIHSDVPGVLFNSRTLVPLRFVSEALGASVEWDANSGEVKVKSKSKDVATDVEVKTIEFSDGKVYKGMINEGKAQGKGVLTYPNGNIYTGDFSNGDMEGYGIVVWANGDRYEGNYAGNKRNGQGTYYFANGDIYVGEYKDDLRHGKGVFTFASGEVFIGTWVNGDFKSQ